jgi:hypothetical protein
MILGNALRHQAVYAGQGNADSDGYTPTPFYELAGSDIFVMVEYYDDYYCYKLVCQDASFADIGV